MKPDEPVWCIWSDKEGIVEDFNGQEYEDSEGNWIEVVKADVTDEVFQTIMDTVDSDDYLWERFNDTLRETTAEVIGNHLKEIKDEEELWEGELNGNATSTSGEQVTQATSTSTN
jgi:hypothetical protein